MDLPKHPNRTLPKRFEEKKLEVKEGEDEEEFELTDSDLEDEGEGEVVEVEEKEEEEEDQEEEGEESSSEEEEEEEEEGETQSESESSESSSEESSESSESSEEEEPSDEKEIHKFGDMEEEDTRFDSLVDSKQFKKTLRGLRTLPRMSSFKVKKKKKKKKQRGKKKHHQIRRKPRTTHVVTITMDQLAKHRNPVDYVCPKFEVTKFNPFTKMKILTRNLLFEVNMIEKRFSGLKRSDFSVVNTYRFEDIVDFEMFQTKIGQNVLGITFKDKKLPRRLIFSSKAELWKFNELCKIARPGTVVWIPEMVDSNDHDVKKVELTGHVHQIKYSHRGKGNRESKSSVVRMDVKGTDFLVGAPLDRVLVYCASWNVSRSLPKDTTRLKPIIHTGADLYAICFLHSGYTKQNEGYLDDYFITEEYTCPYRKLAEVIIPGSLALYVFVNQSVEKRVTKTVSSFKKGTNKKLPYSCAKICVVYNESPILFLGVGGLPKLMARKEHVYREMLGDEMNDFHHVFLLGDLGYSVSVPRSVALSFVDRKMGDMIRQFDEMSIHKEKRGALFGFDEGEIKFLPTFPVVDSDGNSKSKAMYDPKETRTPLAYSNRILVRSVTGMKHNVKRVRTSSDVLDYSKHKPVYSLTSISTQRCHVSHFSIPSNRRRVLKFAGVYVAGYTGEAEETLKDPQLRITGEWLETSVVCTKRNIRRGATRNPKFLRKEIPRLTPIKFGIDFLSSCFLKFELIDQSCTDEKSMVKGSMVYSLRELMRMFWRKKQKKDSRNNKQQKKSTKKVSAGVWFAKPIELGAMCVGDLVGYISVIELEAGKEVLNLGGVENVEEEDVVDDEVSQDVVDTFENFG